MSNNLVLQKFNNIVKSSEPYTDIDICAGEPVMVRYSSGWARLDVPGWSRDEVESLIAKIDSDWFEKIHTDKINVNYPTDEWTLRVTAYNSFGGTKPMISIRRSPRYPMSIQDAGLPPQVRILAESPRGLVLMVGATGSGKSTTTAALVQHINATRRAKVVTIEDPIEYLYMPINSTFAQREVGIDTPSFYEGVRGAMRQRPDVIVIGEIRDRDTAETAFMAGESGHLVLATLHANSAYGAIQKLINYFPGESESRLISLATCLVGVINHVMVPHVDQKQNVLATELLFNHKQQVSSFIGNKEKVNEYISTSSKINQGDGVSKSLVDSLTELVAAKKISPRDALASVIGQGTVYDSLRKVLST